jgi:nucleosome binding factor SPN SPT16 subunit
MTIEEMEAVQDKIIAGRTILADIKNLRDMPFTSDNQKWVSAEVHIAADGKRFDLNLQSDSSRRRLFNLLKEFLLSETKILEKEFEGMQL